jgi:HTH-type transcriptional regulator, sugar sensing transcriptional regulator
VQREQALELLKAAGMSGYESKAYLALLVSGTPLNGYEVAKASGVPRSTVYETLAKLVGRGAAFEVNGSGSGVDYVALPSEALIGRLRRDLAGTIDGLAQVLPALGGVRDAHVVQHLHGLDGVLERAIDVIEAANRDLFASIWPDEIEHLRPAFGAASARGVEISLISFGELAEPIGRSYVHRYSEPDVVLARLGCRIFTVVADRDAVLIGGVDRTEAWGMWSDDPAVALVAAEYVRHDIALQLIGNRLRDAGLEQFWQTDPELERLRASAAVADSLRDRS